VIPAIEDELLRQSAVGREEVQVVNAVPRGGEMTGGAKKDDVVEGSRVAFQSLDSQSGE